MIKGPSGLILPASLIAGGGGNYRAWQAVANSDRLVRAPLTYPLTISMWHYFDGNSDGHVWGAYSGSGNELEHGVHITFDGIVTLNIAWDAYGSSYGSNEVFAPVGVWYNLIITLDDSFGDRNGMAVYVNGQEITLYGVDVIGALNNFVLGNAGGGDSAAVNSRFAEVGIWNRALSPEERTNLWQAKWSPTKIPAGLISAYRFPAGEVGRDAVGGVDLAVTGGVTVDPPPGIVA